MMKRAAFLAMALGMMASASPAQLVSDPLQSDTPSDANSEQLKSLADTCAAHKFETFVRMDGRPKPSRVKICGEPGQTDASWLVTLKDSITKTEANPEFSPSVKNQIVGALKAEIARLESRGSTSTVVSTASNPINLTPQAPREPAPEYSTLPPLPAPKKPAPVRLSGGAPSTYSEPVAPVVKPKLVVRCAIPHESFATCARLERESQLMVSAGEDVPAGTSLRFLRGGDNRAELDLGALKKGDSMREKLPGRVCSGVLRGKVQLQVVTAKGQIADTMGPYNLYCGS